MVNPFLPDDLKTRDIVDRVNINLSLSSNLLSLPRPYVVFNR